MKIAAYIVGLTTVVLTAPYGAGGATFVGDSYALGTWSGTTDSQTYTGNNVDSKIWEFENVAFGGPGSVNTSIATTSRDPSYYIHKYESDTPIGSLEFRYSDGYLQEDIAANDLAYVDFSTDGVSWVRIWDMQGTAAWTDFFNTATWVGYELPIASGTVYLKHGSAGAYAGLWQMYGSAGDSGVRFAEAVPEPASLGLLAAFGIMCMGRKRRAS